MVYKQESTFFKISFPFTNFNNFDTLSFTQVNSYINNQHITCVDKMFHNTL